nr:ImmA/IrrE family metallo-endopeptidase [uncultured Agathobaculum sp.]
MSEFLVPPASKQDIKRLASTIRKKFGLGDVEFFPVVEMIEVVLPMFDSQFNYFIVEDCECGLDEANYDPRQNLMRIRRSVYDGAWAGNGRDRFTLAHELGHYFMHRDVDLALSRINDRHSVPAYCNSEWQANTFASALLMPDHIIKDMWPNQIARICGTSLRAAEIAYKQKKK